MSDFGREGRTVVFVSHDLGAVVRLCPRTIWLDRGALRADGPSDAVIADYVGAETPQASVAAFQERPGAPVQLVSAAVTDAHGAPRGAPVRDEPLTLTLRLVVRERIPGLGVALILEGPHGVPVLDEDWSADTGGSLEPERVPQEYEVRLTVPPVLAAGEYALVAWAGTPYATVLRERALVFRLRPRPDDTTESVERRRLVQPGVVWSVRALEPLTLRQEARGGAA
jgi:ABC-2 type transport system ATP-binding protein/lipopolysaccharide transport system ATP-binding protein